MFSLNKNTIIDIEPNAQDKSNITHYLIALLFMVHSVIRIKTRKALRWKIRVIVTWRFWWRERVTWWCPSDAGRTHWRTYLRRHRNTGSSLRRAPPPGVTLEAHGQFARTSPSSSWLETRSIQPPISENTIWQHLDDFLKSPSLFDRGYLMKS